MRSQADRDQPQAGVGSWQCVPCPLSPTATLLPAGPAQWSPAFLAAQLPCPHRDQGAQRECPRQRVHVGGARGARGPGVCWAGTRMRAGEVEAGDSTGRDLCSVGEPATSPDLLPFSSVTLGRSPAPKPRSRCPLISYMGHGGGWGGAVQNWCSPPRPCLARMSQNPVAMRATREYMENSVGSESVLQVRLQG